jgi:hypothetical protein
MSAVYEVTGPTKTQVIEYELKKYQKQYPKVTESRIKEILELEIPGLPGDCSYGSWRGYGTFGIRKEWKDKIEAGLLLENKS